MLEQVRYTNFMGKEKCLHLPPLLPDSFTELA